MGFAMEVHVAVYGGGVVDVEDEMDNEDVVVLVTVDVKRMVDVGDDDDGEDDEKEVVVDETMMALVEDVADETDAVAAEEITLVEDAEDIDVVVVVPAPTTNR